MDLGEKDLEVDGCPVGVANLRKPVLAEEMAPHIHEKSNSINPTFDSGMGTDSLLEGECDELGEMTKTFGDSDNKIGVCLNDEQIDSGNGSLSLEQLQDKLPVQCTDESYSFGSSDLFHKMDKLSLSDKDEGIGSMSMTYSSGASLPSMPEPIEIDLYETDEDGDTLVHGAILNNKTELAIAMIELAENVDCLNIENELHQTPLHLSVLLGNDSVTESLLERRVDVTVRDHLGNTPLHIACRLGDQDATQRIIASLGTDMPTRKRYFAVKNREGLTCLHLASQYQEYMIMGHLFAKGADVNIGDAKSGRTVLHYAVERKDLESVALLLTHADIDVDCKTFKGETPLVMAYWRNYKSILRKLKSNGAYFSYDIVEDSEDEYST